MNSKLIYQCKRYIAQLVYDTAALEDSPFTFPEVQTLLDGVTVGGHKLSDQQLIINQRDSWNDLFSFVETGKFTISKNIACSLQAKAVKEEALEWGCFRTGSVRISGTEYKPPKANELDVKWDEMLASINQIKDIKRKSILLFLKMARTQFFWDGNKRTGRLMMNGILLSEGISPILIPAKAKLEFNTKMISYYNGGDVEEMTSFLSRFHIDFD